MEDDLCPKSPPPVPFKPWKRMPTTLFVNGRSGWSCVSENWRPISRRSVRQLLRRLRQHLTSRGAINGWMMEEEN